MRKIFVLLFLFFCSFLNTFAFDKPQIITRQEWWADDSFMDKNWPEWKKIYESIEKAKAKPKTPEQIEKENKAREKTKEINRILVNDYREDNEISDTQTTYNWKELVWPIEHSKKIRAIVVHHTHSSFKDSYEWIRSVYKYHSLTNGRWDIGYNFLIWINWEIFEWRAWWETAVWAHALRNNRQTIGISLIWNYDKEPISQAQYDSLYKLTKYLVEKYWIDLNKQEAFHRNCNRKDCVSPLETNYHYPIIGHRDAAHTDCPGQRLYDQLVQIRKDLLQWKVAYYSENQEKYFDIFERIPEQRLINVMEKIEEILAEKYDSRVAELRAYLLKYLQNKSVFQTSNRTDKDIKIKLSYPEDRDYITISDGLTEYKIEKKDNKLYVDWKEVENFSLKNGFHPFVEITSWDRTPVWDREKRYKDNKFRWEIFIYLKNNKLVVVNILKIEDYLKWLGEISNNENETKAEAIMIAARTYALWYVEKDRKFPWEFYDWSDDPDIFQKYLWYDLELRSPSLNKAIDKTKWIVVTYNWEIVKTWYFSRSEGKTFSFYEYCIKNKNSVQYCEEESKKYPFLQSKIDLWWIWKTQSWHWVWLSGTWASYLSSRWWTSSMILKYFYNWVEIK